MRNTHAKPELKEEGDELMHVVKETGEPMPLESIDEVVKRMRGHTNTTRRRRRDHALHIHDWLAIMLGNTHEEPAKRGDPPTFMVGDA